MFQIGDLVTRNSYHNDIVFKIIDIVNENYILKGINVRLVADSDKSDLKICNTDEVTEEEVDFNLDSYKTLDRSEYFYMPGKILHIDADHLCNSEFEKVL